MTASVIICTRNRAESLRRTLQSLARLEMPDDWECELIIVDNASQDNTAEVAKAEAPKTMAFKLVAEERRGLSHARDTGLSVATGDVILFTDDDVQLEPRWLFEMADPILCEEAHAIAGGARCAPHLMKPWMTTMHTAWLGCFEPNGTLRAPLELIGVNMAFARDVLTAVPAFDTELGAGALGFGEESLFSAQLVAAGFEMSVAPDATVEHHFDETRLLRASFLSAAKMRGGSMAYKDYHWEQRDMPALNIRLLRARVRLAAWRRSNPDEIERVEGIAEQELELAFAVSYFEAMVALRGAERKYDRRGLVKKGSQMPPAPRERLAA